MIWSIILAAGASSRFGSPKALATWQRGTLLSRIIGVASSVTFGKVLVVVGSDKEQILPHILTVHFIDNEKWTDGLGSTIRVGLEEVLRIDPLATGIVLLPVDQPFVDETHISNLIHLAKEEQKASFTGSQSLFGPPAVLLKLHFQIILSHRDKGGLKLLVPETDRVYANNPDAFIDADTPEALSELNHMHTCRFDKAR